MIENGREDLKANRLFTRWAGGERATRAVVSGWLRRVVPPLSSPGALHLFGSAG